MSSVDSQVVDGVWGQPIADPGPAAPEYNPSADRAAEPAPDNLPIGQEQVRTSVWDTPPTDEYVQVAQPQQDQTPNEPQPQEAAAAPAPDESLRQQVEEMRNQLAQREQREQEGKRLWEQQVRQHQQNQVWETRQQAMRDAIDQAQYLDTDAQKTFLTQQFGQIENQYRNDYQQLQQTAEQDKHLTLRNAMAPLYAQELLQTNGIPAEFMQYLKGVNPDSMEAMVPTLKAMSDMQAKLSSQMQQTEATNFNAYQRQNGVNRIASSNGSPAGVGSVKSGSPEHLRALMDSMETRS